MYKSKLKLDKIKPTTLKVNTSYIGETVEQKVNRVVNNKEPITDGAPQIYTERKDGVKAEYDIRTDRFEVATEAMDYVNKSKLAKREQSIKERAEAANPTKTEDIQRTEIIPRPNQSQSGA